MAERSEAELLAAIQQGDQAAFERLYDRYQQQVRLMAWRVSHRPDWLDDLLNEAWCRAFRQRCSYDSATAFPVWLAGILRNVYREHCRDSLRSGGEAAASAAKGAQAVDSASPERLAAEAELLAGLNDCVGRLPEADRKLIQLRFFKALPLRAVAQEVKVPESTLREVRMPAAYEALRRCLQKKGLDFSSVFPAQEGGKDQ